MDYSRLSLKSIAFILLMVSIVPLQSMSRERQCFDSGWLFAFGDASSPEKDFGCGTEYFNYLTKVASIHNRGPYSPDFNPDNWNAGWKEISLPHDFVVDLPFAPEASHSHGYKTVGYRYPATSVGWYVKHFDIPASDLGRRIILQFDGIFRDARLWVNGFYLGSEPSGYATRTYDITDYLNYGASNLLTVRADATLEEGWFYEGGGIYRHVWLEKTHPVHVAPFGIHVVSLLEAPFDMATMKISAEVANRGLRKAGISLRHTLFNPGGLKVGHVEGATDSLLPMATVTPAELSIRVANPQLWSPDRPHLYRLMTEVLADGLPVDTVWTTTGIRHIRFDPDHGFFLNGKSLKIKGVNMHHDHAGVGTAIPDALQAYRLHKLKELGVNAYRSSHNPMSPPMLDACDSIGMLVIEENRLPGVNEEQLKLLRDMIRRDCNHPSIIAWSVGNEEWGIEWDPKSERLIASLREFCHRTDSMRPMTVATSGGPNIVVEADVAGYNYILQNPVDAHRTRYPLRCALGSEETSGCGTRGIYFDDHGNGLTSAINRHPHGPDSLLNCIERGWKFYDARPWLAGLFFWTGFDYRGEPNPLKFPATGSQFGILDYCGFPKDEAFYLKSWWTSEPVLHIFPHWNLHGHEGETIDIWAYSNCGEVELICNGRSLGRKPMPPGGHLSWPAVYHPGKIVAIGYRNGKKVLERSVETTGAPATLLTRTYRPHLLADGLDVAVVDISVIDSKGRFVPDACIPIDIQISGPAIILGTGNGNPAFRTLERPQPISSRSFSITTFNGHAQILVRSLSHSEGNIELTLSSATSLPPARVSLTSSF